MEPINSRVKIAVFASGNGSNAENLIRYFRESGRGGEVALVIANRSDARVLARAEGLGVPAVYLAPSEIRDAEVLLPLLLDRYGIDAIVLAGFLQIVPAFVVARYSGKILNVHPSLLPKFGGKGMYGRYVHEAVVAAGEPESGITVHHVSERYDEGAVVFQASVALAPDETSESLEEKIHGLEREHFPRVVAETLCR